MNQSRPWSHLAHTCDIDVKETLNNHGAEPQKITSNPFISNDFNSGHPPSLALKFLLDVHLCTYYSFHPSNPLPLSGIFI